MPTGTLLEKTSRIIEGGLWVEEADLHYDHQTYLAERLSITPDVKQGIYPFKDIKLTRAEVAWLLKTHENGRGHVDWHDESQGKREGLDLRGADLRGVDLHDLPLARIRGGLTGNEWLKATTEERKQAAVHLEDADLHGAHLEGADLRMAQMDRADLRTAHLEHADLGMASLQEANLTGGGLEDARLMRAFLQRAYLRAARLENADLREAHLEGARLFQADLQGADLHHAKLDQADLRGAVLLGAKLGHAKLVQADLRGAVLRGANLRDAKLDQVDLRAAILTKDQKGLLQDSNVIGLDETNDHSDSIPRSIIERYVVSSPEYQLEKILHKHIEMVLAGHSLEETLVQLVQGACKLAGILPSAQDTIRVIDPETLILQWDFLGDGQVLPYDNTPLNVGVTGRAVAMRVEQIVDNVFSDRDYISTDERVRSEMAVPLIMGDRCWGVLNLESDQPGYFHRALLPWMRILANQAVLTVQNEAQRQRLYQIQNTNKGIEAMLREQDVIHMQHARERVLRDLVDAAIQQTGSQFGSIMIAVQVPDGPGRIEKDTPTEMVLLVAQPQHEKLDIAEQHFPVTKGIVGEAYQTRQLRVKDVDDYSAELVAPLYVDDQVLGVLSLRGTKAEAYSAEQLAWAELLASQIANVLSSAQLHLLRRQIVGLHQIEREMMIESLRDDRGPINNALLRRILRTALDLTEQPDGYASFWLTDGNGLSRCEFLTDDESVLRKEMVDAISGGIVGMVQTHQTPVLALDVAEPPWSENIVRNWQATRSELAVPLLDLSRPEGDSRRVVGVLNIESRRKFDFDEKDITILELLAQIIVMAMHSHDIYNSKIILLRDITHAFEKTIWPLRVCAAGLRRRPFDPTQPGFEEDKYKDRAAEIASLTDLAGNLLGWFQQLVKYEDSDAIIDLQPASMMRIVQQIVERMRPFALNEDKQIEVIEPLPDFEVACAADLVKAALFLLIENALNYSPRNDTVSVHLYQLPSGDARIEVIDHGIPVPFNERDFLFDAGFRGSNADATLTGGRAVGSGLGLDHVRRIVVKLHKGQVGYEYLEGKNVFYIQLPLG